MVLKSNSINLTCIFAAIYVLPGLIGTHLFREVIRRSGWLQLPVEKVLPKFLIGILFTCLGCGLIRIGAIDILGLNHTKKAPDFLPELMASTAEFGSPIIPWTLIYYFYHYIENSRKQQVDTLKLEALVKELELKTIKAHINPHFIFNALNSIRALIDENPVRARQGGHRAQQYPPQQHAGGKTGDRDL